MSTKIHTEMTSDGKQLFGMLQKASKEIEKLTNENRKLRDESKRAHKEAKDGADEAALSMHDLLGDVNLVSLATKAATVVWQDWSQTIGELTEKNRQFNQEMIAGLRKAGDLAKAGQIDTALRGIAGAKPSQGQAAFAGLTASGPSMSVDERLRMVDEMAPLMRAGSSEQDLFEFAQNMGELRDVAPGKSANDLADLTQALSEATRGDFGKLGGPKQLSAIGKLTQTGMSPDEALGFAAAALDANQPATVAAQLAAHSTEDLVKRKGKTPQDLAFNRAVGLSPEERRELMMQDNSVAAALGGEGFALSLAQITPEAVAARTKALQDAQRNDAARNVTASMRGSLPGLKELHRQQGEAEHASGGELAAFSSTEEILANIEKGSMVHDDWIQRTARANRIRANAFFSGSGAEAAHGVLQSEFTQRVQSKQMTPAEEKYWLKELDLLARMIEQQQEIITNQKNGPINPNANIDR